MTPDDYRFLANAFVIVAVNLGGYVALGRRLTSVERALAARDEKLEKTVAALRIEHREFCEGRTVAVRR